MGAIDVTLHLMLLQQFAGMDLNPARAKRSINL